MLRPVGSIRLAGMMLFGNGRPVCGSVMTMSAPVVGFTVREKSPFRSASVGTVASAVSALCCRVPS